MEPSLQPVILLIGLDPSLVYLLGRFAERSGYRLITVGAGLSTAEVEALRPAAILFNSIQSLEAAQPLINALANGSIPLLVCTAAADQAQALELGVDACLLHPLTYDDFLTTLAALPNHQRLIED